MTKHPVQVVKSISPVFRFLRRPWYRRVWYGLRIRLGRGPVVCTPGLELARQLTGVEFRIVKLVSDYEAVTRRIKGPQHGQAVR